MGSIRVMAAALAASAAFVVLPAAPANAANTCRAACDKTFQQCQKGDTAKCLPSWHQCKTKCNKGATAAVATKPTPAQARAIKTLTPEQAKAAAAAAPGKAPPATAG